MFVSYRKGEHPATLPHRGRPSSSEAGHSYKDWEMTPPSYSRDSPDVGRRSDLTPLSPSSVSPSARPSRSADIPRGSSLSSSTPASRAHGTVPDSTDSSDLPLRHNSPIKKWEGLLTRRSEPAGPKGDETPGAPHTTTQGGSAEVRPRKKPYHPTTSKVMGEMGAAEEVSEGNPRHHSRDAVPARPPSERSTQQSAPSGTSYEADQEREGLSRDEGSTLKGPSLTEGESEGGVRQGRHPGRVKVDRGKGEAEERAGRGHPDRTSHSEVVQSGHVPSPANKAMPIRQENKSGPGERGGAPAQDYRDQPREGGQAVGASIGSEPHPRSPPTSHTSDTPRTSRTSRTSHTPHTSHPSRTSRTPRTAQTLSPSHDPLPQPVVLEGKEFSASFLPESRLEKRDGYRDEAMSRKPRGPPKGPPKKGRHEVSKAPSRRGQLEGSKGSRTRPDIRDSPESQSSRHRKSERRRARPGSQHEVRQPHHEAQPQGWTVAEGRPLHSEGAQHVTYPERVPEDRRSRAREEEMPPHVGRGGSGEVGLHEGTVLFPTEFTEGGVRTLPCDRGYDAKRADIPSSGAPHPHAPQAVQVTKRSTESPLRVSIPATPEGGEDDVESEEWLPGGSIPEWRSPRRSRSRSTSRSASPYTSGVETHHARETRLRSYPTSLPPSSPSRRNKPSKSPARVVLSKDVARGSPPTPVDGEGQLALQRFLEGAERQGLVTVKQRVGGKAWVPPPAVNPMSLERGATPRSTPNASHTPTSPWVGAMATPKFLPESSSASSAHEKESGSQLFSPLTPPNPYTEDEGKRAPPHGESREADSGADREPGETSDLNGSTHDPAGKAPEIEASGSGTRGGTSAPAASSASVSQHAEGSDSHDTHGPYGGRGQGTPDHSISTRGRSPVRRPRGPGGDVPRRQADETSDSTLSGGKGPARGDRHLPARGEGHPSPADEFGRGPARGE
eukprot:Sspe_Gene.69580::Locus_41015_Transcript_1_2_Confidence_0.667_Length_2939::g.69580::m.69580